MDFQLSDEQVLLRDTSREVLTRTYDIETRLKVVDSELGWSRDVWNQLAEIGILGLGFEEDAGGQLEIMVVATEIGRRLAPEPVISAALGPGALIAEVGSDEQKQVLDEVASGERLLAFAHTEPGMRSAGSAVSTTAAQQGDSWSLTGRKNPVIAGDSADLIVVSAALPDGGTGLFLVEGSAVTRTPYRTFDGQRGAQLDLDGVAAQPLGAGGDATDAISRTLVRLQSALCAEALGAMEEALRLTTEYLTSRKQFGVTLSKFQTLTQRAADMYVSLELARSMTYYAAMSVADGNFDPAIAARAKLQIGRSGRHIAQEAIQLHGGIGVTAEYPVGHYAARLTAIDNTLGSALDQLHVLIDGLGDYEVVTV
ncbi:acyl-CoA dehydrogenase family protein [Mycolicibacterium litorale]|uniref:Acyl-CoA dehydrogenase n=1 Tax=Mycolicibacterium litorale TaxID=758802 RepID=A0AAD1MWI4_9MYCO|nr:acyl-CoA dehydrogenase family protein [Mycolicibacterium litorale]MCV7417640.1 acyl-CoA dehydrogenase family protein [Mycolicibacterium litorale]TDY06974.1 alkylation response protein AidB-like acyl-CoA dehydrogenase [Mycolicibacterium litorale]BBY18868.1 acyl-CoA dehydrogenase [Mycolicibacterium litorale]